MVFNCELLFIVGIILDFSEFPSTKDPISRHYVVPQVLLVVKVKQLLLTLVTIIVLHLKKTYFFCMRRRLSIVSRMLSMMNGCLPRKLLNWIDRSWISAVSRILSLLPSRLIFPISRTKAFDFLMIYTARSCLSHICNTVSLVTGHFCFDAKENKTSKNTNSHTKPFKIAVMIKKYLSTKIDCE